MEITSLERKSNHNSTSWCRISSIHSMENHQFGKVIKYLNHSCAMLHCYVSLPEGGILIDIPRREVGMGHQSTGRSSAATGLSAKFVLHCGVAYGGDTWDMNIWGFPWENHRKVIGKS